VGGADGHGVRHRDLEGEPRREEFMHLPLEKHFIWYIEGIVVAFMLLFFFAVSPDVMQHEGRNWENRAAIAAVERGKKEGAERKPTASTRRTRSGRRARGERAAESRRRRRTARGAAARRRVPAKNNAIARGRDRGRDRMIDTIAERLTPERRESREVVPSAVLGVLRSGRV
jgi:hypothetical protein